MALRLCRITPFAIDAMLDADAARCYATYYLMLRYAAFAFLFITLIYDKACMPLLIIISLMLPLMLLAFLTSLMLFFAIRRARYAEVSRYAFAVRCSHLRLHYVITITRDADACAGGARRYGGRGEQLRAMQAWRR